MKTFLVKDPNLIAVWKPVLIDDEDEIKVKKYVWHLDKQGSVRTAIYLSPGNRKNIFLHRYILNLEQGDPEVGLKSH